jgi:hypothetical protein
MTDEQRQERNVKRRAHYAANAAYRDRVQAIRRSPEYKAKRNKQRRERYAADAEHRNLLNQQNNQRRQSNPAFKAWDTRHHSRLPVRLRRAAQYAGRRAAKAGRPCDITAADLMELWKLQRGRCQYSGVVMTPAVGRPNTLSVERIDSSRGYTRDNVILVCDFANRMKLDYPLDAFVGYCHAIAAHNPTQATEYRDL